MVQASVLGVNAKSRPTIWRAGARRGRVRRRRRRVRLRPARPVPGRAGAGGRASG